MAKTKIVKKENKDKNRIAILEEEILTLQDAVKYWSNTAKGEAKSRNNEMDRVRIEGNFALLRQENTILKAQNEYFRGISERLIFPESVFKQEDLCDCNDLLCEDSCDAC